MSDNVIAHCLNDAKAESLIRWMRAQGPDVLRMTDFSSRNGMVRASGLDDDLLVGWCRGYATAFQYFADQAAPSPQPPTLAEPQLSGAAMRVDDDTANVYAREADRAEMVKQNAALVAELAGAREALNRRA